MELGLNRAWADDDFWSVVLAEVRLEPLAGSIRQCRSETYFSTNHRLSIVPKAGTESRGAPLRFGGASHSLEIDLVSKDPENGW
jgi:hypothetical protein